MRMLRIFIASFLVLMVGSTALAAGRLEPGTWPRAELAKSGRVAVPSQVQKVTTGITLAAASPTFPGTGTVTVGSHTFTIGEDAFATIQAAIDAVDPGGTVWVLPGDYLEKAEDRYLYNGAGPYQFGIFVGVDKPNLTIMGVDDSGNPIMSYAGVLSMVDTQARNTFGTSGFFIEGDHCTITGIGVGVNDEDPQKTIEVIGDAFTIKYCDLADVWGGVIYINDYRFDSITNTSYVESYRVEENNFQEGMDFQAASGAGYSGPVGGRVVTGNAFKMTPGQNWASITFNGTGGVGWFVYPVGGAVITGNTFDNTDPTGQHIKARGDYLNAQMDWASYWNDNTFNKAVCEGVVPPGDLRAYDYSVYTNARRIGSVIKDQVDQALSGDIVLVKDGAYTEQIVVTTSNLTIQGAGRLATTVQSPATLTTSIVTPSVKYPVVLVNGVTGVTIRDLTVDGLGLGNTNYQFVGVAFWNAGGKLLDADVKHIEDTPFSGAQHGVGVYAYNNTGGPYNLELGGVNVTDFQKNGMALSGTGLTVDLHDCTAVGKGPTTVTAQNGIQVSYSAGGTVNGCTVSAVDYTPADWSACGLLLYQAGTVNMSDPTVTNCQTGVYFDQTNSTVTGLDLSGGTWASGIYNSSATVATSATATDATIRERPQAAAFEEAQVVSSLARLSSTAAMFNVSLNGGCLAGTDVAGSSGIWVWSAGGGLSASLTNLEIKDWDYAIVADGSVSITANHNAITSNLSAGFDNTLPPSALQNAELNWWGNVGGPGVGGANPVLGPNVDYTPWLIAGTDLEPACGFSPPLDNLVAPVAPSVCLTPAHSCVAVPVNISRTTPDNVRAFSVKVTLSGNLSLCTPNIEQGTYLNTVAGTAYEVVDHLDGTYTVDCAILGATCGATAPTGTLFTVNVSSSVPGGTGSVAVSDLLLRDCENLPVPASAGASAVITIDNTAPVAIAALAAAQVKTGNGADGRTGITVSWPAVESGATVHVYRAGFGSYPEYDDAGGAVPSYPAVGSWVLAGDVTSGTTLVDEPGTRDFWYYVALVEDACGNVGPVSNRTGGTLNYHLGDVADGTVTLCAGNNKVYTEDVSFLGFHYGITLTLGDPFNCLDVGPTTNYSVNARPLTDNKVNFEDLMMFAINYNPLVLAPQDAALPVAAATSNRLWLEGPAKVSAGATFTVQVQAACAGDLQGLSLQLAWNHAVAEPVSVEAGPLAALQNGVVFSSGAGNVDAALLGANRGLTGEGVLATVTFQALASGAPNVTLAKVAARDAANQPVELAGVKPAGPVTTSFARPMPNPFRGTTTLSYALAQGGAVELAVYGVDGRKVAVLASGVQEAGSYRLTWDGAGARPGLYYARLTTPEGRFTRTLVLTK